MNYIELDKELNSLAYHGRGIIIGKSPDEIGRASCRERV